MDRACLGLPHDPFADRPAVSYQSRGGRAAMFTTPRLVAIALCAALNFVIGSIVYLVKLPIYLDSIGVILCALLLATDRRVAFVCCFTAAVTSTVVTGLLVNPFLPWFIGTDLTIALMSAFVTSRGAETFRARPLRPVEFVGLVLLFGVLTGIAAAIVSAPVVAYVFGGVTGSGSAFLVGMFLKTGQQLWNATLASGLIADPIDKTLQVLVAALLFRATPSDFIALVRGKPAHP
jgi:energy-coupling factor transport system substrate-specific component